jgi:hypothetical protein
MNGGWNEPCRFFSVLKPDVHWHEYGKTTGIKNQL